MNVKYSNSSRFFSSSLNHISCNRFYRDPGEKRGDDLCRAHHADLSQHVHQESRWEAELHRLLRALPLHVMGGRGGARPLHTAVPLPHGQVYI